MVAVLGLVVAGLVGDWVIGGDDEELGAFDPDSLAWRTHRDPAEAYSIDLPGEPEAAPARLSGVDALAVRGPVTVDGSG